LFSHICPSTSNPKINEDHPQGFTLVAVSPPTDRSIPFFEVGIGAYLDGRTRAQWLISLLIFTFFYNIVICTKAFADLIVAKALGHNGNYWAKTAHSGNGNGYILK
jgi:hypothetical protein